MFIVAPAEMHEMVAPLTNALPHLQPPKRLRGKVAEEAQGVPQRRRRRRVSDEEAEQIQLARQIRSIGRAYATDNLCA